MKSFYKIENNWVIIKIWVQPNASKTQIVGEYRDRLKIALQSPPVEGAANRELIKFFQKRFKIPKSQIQLKGEKSRQKEVVVPFNSKLVEFLSTF